MDTQRKLSYSALLKKAEMLSTENARLREKSEKAHIVLTALLEQLYLQLQQPEF